MAARAKAKADIVYINGGRGGAALERPRAVQKAKVCSARVQYILLPAVAC